MAGSLSPRVAFSCNSWFRRRKYSMSATEGHSETRLSAKSLTILTSQSSAGVVASVQRQYLLSHVHRLCTNIRDSSGSCAVTTHLSACLRWALFRTTLFLCHAPFADPRVSNKVKEMFSAERLERAKERESQREESERLALKKKEVKRKVGKYDRRPAGNTKVRSWQQ